MSIVDKVVASVTPEPSDERRATVRRDARTLDGGSGWLSHALDHHERIEACFEAVRAATDTGARRAAQAELALILTGHSIAEEAVLYPAMALDSQKAHSTSAYTQQRAAKVQLAALDELDPLSQDYLDKLEHLRAAVAHHIHEEESNWFPALRRHGDASLHQKLTQRYGEEFDRYCTGGQGRSGSAATSVGAGAQAHGAHEGSGSGPGVRPASAAGARPATGR